MALQAAARAGPWPPPACPLPQPSVLRLQSSSEWALAAGRVPVDVAQLPPPTPLKRQFARLVAGWKQRAWRGDLWVRGRSGRVCPRSTSLSCWLRNVAVMARVPRALQPLALPKLTPGPSAHTSLWDVVSPASSLMAWPRCPEPVLCCHGCWEPDTAVPPDGSCLASAPGLSDPQTPAEGAFCPHVSSSDCLLRMLGDIGPAQWQDYSHPKILSHTCEVPCATSGHEGTSPAISASSGAGHVLQAPKTP